MTAMQARSTGLVLAGCLLAVLTTAGPLRGQQRAAQDLTAEQSGRYHYGILGPVGRVGTHVSVHNDLTLAELVAAAGGCHSELAGAAVVIRDGRAQQRLDNPSTSTHRLSPGDVVVLKHPAAAGSTKREDVTVALVGVRPSVPVVVSLPKSLAPLPRLIAALHQDAGLIRSLQVIRAGGLLPQISASRVPRQLVDGDVVVFEPSAIDQARLARAEAFPEPMRIPPREGTADRRPVIQPGQVQLTSARFSPPPAPPAQDQQPAERPVAGEFDEGIAPATMPAGTIPGSDDGLTPVEGPLHEHDEPEQLDASGAEAVVATSLIATAQQSRPQPTATGRATTRNTSAASESAGAPHLWESDAGEAPQKAAAATTGRPARASRGRFGSRATTLGITVLATALLCFIAALVWSRLDDSTGLPQTPLVQNQEQPQVPDHSLAEQRRTLNRLINNTLPLIEETAVPPAHADYHGEAVGRRRLRIDAGQNLSGPHFPAVRGQDSQTDAGADTSQTAGGKRQSDQHGEGPSDHAEQTLETNTNRGGLLERVLVAMEREKQR